MAMIRKASHSFVLRRAKIAALAATLAVAGVAGVAGTARADAAASQTQLQVSARPFAIDGKKVYLPAALVNGESYIGLRSLNDQLGIATSWDPKTKVTTLTGRGRTMQLTPASEYRLNGERLYASPAYIQAGSTFVPLRFVLESFGYSIGYDASSKTVSIAPIAENGLSWKTEQLTHAATKLSLTVSYPVFSGMENQEAQAKINAKLKADAEKYAASGRQTLEKAAKDNADAEKSYPDTNIPPVEYEGIYTIAQNSAGLLSLYVDYYVYLGGAHGGTERVPYTFDLKTGNLLTLKDVAGGSADYVPIINRAIQTQIKERKLDLLAPFKTIEADRPFFMKNGAVVVYFEQYEYTPYAAGMPEFAVPLSAFK
ncbi:PdaC/SigV domain-containing protein [Cohnella sp. GCM10012308]|uniref:PdaC/SigV domain-containing protein n=1 Tax=Cohnella sp. GCM10012308 TaxID=3317329 RepID=UPI003614A846